MFWKRKNGRILLEGMEVELLKLNPPLLIEQIFQRMNSFHATFEKLDRSMESLLTSFETQDTETAPSDPLETVYEQALHLKERILAYERPSNTESVSFLENVAFLRIYERAEPSFLGN